MQLRLKQSPYKDTTKRKIILKIILIFGVFFFAIFLLDKMEMPSPSKIIKQNISNDKLITLK